MARPTKYNKEIVEKAKDYLENWKTNTEDVIPSIEGLADVLEVTTKTIYNWKKEENQEFLHILDKILDRQRRTLINGGLKGELNSNITKLALGKHGYSEKSQVDNLSSDGSMSPPDVIEIVPYSGED